METFDERKFREMVIYIAEKSRRDPRFGATKLNKILFCADFTAHRELGRSISGAQYRHLSEGPVAAELPSITTKLSAAGEVAISESYAGAFLQKRIIPQRRADLSVFSDAELAIIDKIIGELWSLGAKQVSELSHGEPAWRLTREGETIPYRTAWLSAEPLTNEQIEAGREIAERHSLLESPTL